MLMTASPQSSYMILKHLHKKFGPETQILPTFWKSTTMAYPVTIYSIKKSMRAQIVCLLNFMSKSLCLQWHWYLKFWKIAWQWSQLQTYWRKLMVPWGNSKKLLILWPLKNIEFRQIQPPIAKSTQSNIFEMFFNDDVSFSFDLWS